MGECGGYYKYLKTGDETGHLCYYCDVPIIIKKSKKKGKTYVYCPCCGERLYGNVGYNSYDNVYL
jgi:hypothetical protein